MSQERRPERRKYPRIRSNDIVSFSEEDVDRLGVSKDFSLGGIRFEAVGCEIDVGKTLRVNFYVGAAFISAVGRVIHATDVDKLTQDVGLEFVEIDPISVAILREHYKEEFPKVSMGAESLME
jgi:hypothetical protein